MRFITSLGDRGYFWIALGIFLLFFKKTRKAGFCVLLSLLIMDIMCNRTIKPLAMRPRPCWNHHIPMVIECLKDYSFPSGHTYASFASAGSVYLKHKKLGVILFILSTLIGFSRLYLFVHWPSDVIFGAVFGMITALVASKLIDLVILER